MQKNMLLQFISNIGDIYFLLKLNIKSINNIMPEMLQILKCMETEVWNIECKVNSNSISVVRLLVI